LGEKLSPEDKGTVNTALVDAKSALESEDIEKMKSAYDSLQKATHKLSEEMYKRAGPGPGDKAGGGAGASASGNGSGSRKDDDDVVDADFEEVRNN
jgi:molecular chaperone DnaK